MGDDDDPKDNLVKGMEAVWTFKRLEDDLYLILNGADGNGFRCFGFQRKDAPYPTFLTWQDTQMDAATGTCGAKVDGSTSADTPSTGDSTTTGLAPPCSSDLDCQPSALTLGSAVTLGEGAAVEQTITAGGVERESARGVLRYAASAATSIEVTMETDTAFQVNPSDACTQDGSTIATADCACDGSGGSVFCAIGSTCSSDGTTCSIAWASSVTVAGVANTIAGVGNGSVGTVTDVFTVADGLVTSSNVAGSGWNSGDADSVCVKESLVVGEWVTDQQGAAYEDIERCEKNQQGLDINCRLDYFCGMTSDINGDAYTKLLSNGGTVWNVKQLGCTKDPQRRWLCGRKPAYENKFLIRSLAGQDVNRDNSITNADYECLFFPQIGGGQYTHPRRAPRAPSRDGVWGGLAADGDGNNDNECGILLPDADMSQEQALVANKQATWALIPLPDY